MNSRHRMRSVECRVLLGLFVVLTLPVLLLGQGAAKPAELLKQGVAAEKAGNWQDATALYRQVLVASPKNGEANFRLGRLMVEHDSAQAGIALLEAARNYRYDPFMVDRYLGQGYYRVGNYSSAIENYLKAIERKPKQADVHAELADIYFDNGNDDDAHDQDSIAMFLDAKNLAARMGHGRVHVRRHDFDVAREEFRKVIALDPNYADAYQSLAELFKTSYPDSAIYYYRHYLVLRPDDATGNFNLSGLYYNKSQREPSNLPAAPATQDTIELKKYARLKDSLTVAYRSEYSESAFVYVGKAIRLGFNREEIYDFYVKIAQAAQKRAASITALQTVLQNNPKDAQKWALLGKVFDDSGDVKQAIESYKTASTLDSTMRRRVYPWIATQYYKMKQYDSSIVYNTKVIEIDPKSASAYVNRGYAYLQNQMKVQGMSDLEKGLSLDPKKIPVRVYLMSLYYQDKDYNQAYDHAKALLELDPNNEQARVIKNNIDVIRHPPKPKE